jgi:HEPN domain-containing protein
VSSLPAPDRAEALRWIAFAEEDWEYAQLGMTSFPRTAAWHFHQAAEKYLKAVLVQQQGVDPPRTHDLMRLLRLVQPTIDEEGDLVTAASELAFYGVASRYPGDFPELTLDEATNAERLAKVLSDFAKARLHL